MQRNREIDFWRVVFSFLVICCHSSNLRLETETFSLFPGGYIGVEFFFILSGFFMARSINRASNNPKYPVGLATFKYMSKKISAIYPAFFTSYIFSYIVISAVYEKTLLISIKDFIFSIFNLLLLTSSGLGIKMGFILGNSWYISAMLLSLSILYPLAYRNWDVYINCLAPFICIFIFSFFLQNHGKIENWSTWHLFTSNGLLRGIAEISLGCICSEASKSLKTIKFKPFGKFLLTVFEFLLFIGVIIGAQYRPKSKWDFIFCLAIAVSLIIVFSEQSYIFCGFANLKGKLLESLMEYAQEFTLLLYLTHYLVYTLIGRSRFSRLNYREKLPFYFWGSILLAIIFMFLTRLVKTIVIRVKKIIIYEVSM